MGVYSQEDGGPTERWVKATVACDSEAVTYVSVSFCDCMYLANTFDVIL